MLSWPTSLRQFRLLRLLPRELPMLPLQLPNIRPDRIDCLDCRPLGPQLPAYRYGQLDSTNLRAWELLAAGVELPFAVTARCQSAGRGQWGRTWASEPGGLYVSLALGVPGPSAAAGHPTAGLPLTLAVAWGIATTFRALAIPIQLKWPNDLLLANRKLGGILCQQRRRGQQTPLATVIGIGINWANAVPPQAIALKPWLTRSDRQPRVTSPAIASLDRLLQLALQGTYQGCNPFFGGEAANDLLESYEKLLTSMGQPVTIGGRTGIVRGVSPNGCLRVSFLDTGEEVLQLPSTARINYLRADNTDP